MAVVIIDDLTEVEDVFELMTYFARALESGDVERLLEEGTVTLNRRSQPTPSRVAHLVRLDIEDEQCEDPWHRPGCSCIADAAATDPRQGLITDAERVDDAVAFVPCPLQGLHASILECWACWCDVNRGALDIADALIDFRVTG